MQANQTPPKSLSLSQRWWRDFQRGKMLEGEVWEFVFRAIKDEDIPNEIATMPAEMFDALSRLVTPVESGPSGVEWEPKAMALSSLVLHAFNFDFAAAAEWKRKRVEMVYHEVQQRGSHPA